jgi:ABC-type lipoprotein release transport system permease subunit
MLDPVTFGAILPALLLAASAAVYLPARRAARVEPMRVLKTD